MTLPKEYFELQLAFARKVAEIIGQTLEDVMREHTSFYKAFQIWDWNFDSQDPIWQEFLAQFKIAEDKAQAAYDFYLGRKDLPDDQQHFGFFSYDYEAAENYIQLHFKNIGEPGPGPLSQERMPARMQELTDMFRDIKNRHPGVASVAGFSWLYNLEAYRRLFPPEFVSTAKLVSGWFKTGALWHQFLDSEWNLKTETVQKFLEDIKDKKTISELEACFPFRILEPECDIQAFYEFYGID